MYEVMSDFVIAIPSLGRAEQVRNKTVAFLLRELVDPSLITVYVVAEEKQVYTEALAEFISHILLDNKYLITKKHCDPIGR
jgi:hypothetical protein